MEIILPRTTTFLAQSRAMVELTRIRVSVERAVCIWDVSLSLDICLAWFLRVFSRPLVSCLWPGLIPKESFSNSYASV